MPYDKYFNNPLAIWTAFMGELSSNSKDLEWLEANYNPEDIPQAGLGTHLIILDGMVGVAVGARYFDESRYLKRKYKLYIYDKEANTFVQKLELTGGESEESYLNRYDQILKMQTPTFGGNLMLGAKLIRTTPHGAMEEYYSTQVHFVSVVDGELKIQMIEADNVLNGGVIPGEGWGSCDYPWNARGGYAVAGKFAFIRVTGRERPPMADDGQHKGLFFSYDSASGGYIAAPGLQNITITNGPSPLEKGTTVSCSAYDSDDEVLYAVMYGISQSTSRVANWLTKSNDGKNFEYLTEADFVYIIDGKKFYRYKNVWYLFQNPFVPGKQSPIVVPPAFISGKKYYYPTPKWAYDSLDLVTLSNGGDGSEIYPVNSAMDDFKGKNPYTIDYAYDKKSGTLFRVHNYENDKISYCKREL